MEKFYELRNKYPVFEYLSYEIAETNTAIDVAYNFNIPGLTAFRPTWSFPKENSLKLSNNDKKLLERLVFNLGMVEVISYLKATCSSKLVVKAGSLSKEQINWFKKLYLNGLGEFFYINGIVEAMNIDTFLDIEANNLQEEILTLDRELNGNLIPVGGGKDSAVTLEVLKEDDNTCYIVNPRGASLECCKIAGYNEKQIYAANRTIDQRLINLNKQGFLNGHTPFSAILAFSSYIASVICGRKNIALSNESSANEANVEGTNINHQYSKSIEFENDFRGYIDSFVCKNGPNYFSLLRPLSEWQIVKAFVKEPKYFEIFKSCNVGSKQDVWCENCPKCLYVYIMMAAVLNENDMKRIFKTDILDNVELEGIFKGLVYPDYDKPFECVGTKEEINLSIRMIIDDSEKKGKDIPKLIKGYGVESSISLDEEIEKGNSHWNSDNNLTEEFETKLRKYIK